MSVNTDSNGVQVESGDKVEECCEDQEELDPRIQVELERLNKSCADVNQLENDLEEAKGLFISSKNKQLERLEYLQKKFGSSISKAKPYYEALALTEKLQGMTKKAVHDFQNTNSLYKTAKETLTVAENSLEQKGEIPDAWQEHLSLTITKITLSKEAADRAEKHHKSVSLEYQKAEQKSQSLEKDLRKYITKSQMYYDEKARWNLQMETQKSHINEIEQTLIHTKRVYKEAMTNLSKISEEIHNRRKLDKMMRRHSEVEVDSPKVDSQLSSETQSLSNESQGSETESKKLKTFLNYYNITLPDNTQTSTDIAKNSEANYTTKTYDELKNCEASEYISLGLNSTASNSRSASPSNSMDADIEWKKPADLMITNENNSVKLINSQSVDSQLISSNPILSKPAQFSSSSLVTSPTRELKNSQSFYSHLSKVPPNHSIDSEGISSLTLNSESSGKSGGEAQRQANTNQKSAHKTKNKVSKNETPLLSFEITKHLYS